DLICVIDRVAGGGLRAQTGPPRPGGGAGGLPAPPDPPPPQGPRPGGPPALRYRPHLPPVLSLPPPPPHPPPPPPRGGARARGWVGRGGSGGLREVPIRRIGIDVGGTNTDAVLLDGVRVVHAVKTPTTTDVTSGITGALRQLLAGVPAADRRVDAAMIGTTH